MTLVIHASHVQTYVNQSTIDEFEHIRTLSNEDLRNERDYCQEQMWRCLRKNDWEEEQEWLHFLDAIYDEFQERGLFEDAC